MTRRSPATLAILVVALGTASACSGEYVPPSRAIWQDMAATSAGGGSTARLTSTTNFRDSDLAAPRR